MENHISFTWETFVKMDEKDYVIMHRYKANKSRDKCHAGVREVRTDVHDSSSFHRLTSQTDFTPTHIRTTSKVIFKTWSNSLGLINSTNGLWI